MKQHKDNYLYSPMLGNFLSWFIAATIISFYVNGKTDNVLILPLGLFIGSIWTLWLHAYREAERIEIKKQRIDHDKRFMVRAGVCFLIGIITHVLAEGLLLIAIVNGIGAGIYLGMIIWLLFDSFLSINRGLKWDYISDDPKAAFSDRLFRKHKWLWVASKILLFFGGLFLYIWILRLHLK